MSIKIRITLWVVISLIVCSLQAQTIPNHIADLDHLLQKTDSLNKSKLKRIAQLELEHTTSLKQIYNKNEKLYQEFFVYNSDSALVYLQENNDIATQMNDSAKLAYVAIQRSFIYSATGLLVDAQDQIEKAKRCISALPESEVKRGLLCMFYEQCIYFFSHRIQYGDEEPSLYKNIEKEKEDYVNQAYALVRQSDKNYYWIVSLYALAHNDQRLINQLIDQLTAYLDSTKQRTRWEAMNAYILAQLYKERNDTPHYINYLAFSAKVDMLICNKDIASLQELGLHFLDNSDINHAYSYLNYCLINSLLYKNRIRIVQLAHLQNRVHQIIMDKNEAQQNRLTHYLAFVIFLLCICMCGFGFIIYQNKRLKHSRLALERANEKLNQHVSVISKAHQELEEANNSLQSLNLRLEGLNEQLTESNYVKEEYVGYAFNLCSSYIAKLDEYRIKINRKLMANQTSDLLKMTSQPIASNESMKDFYHTFDAVFLKIYPNFVTDFNKLLRPEEQIVLKDESTLTMELRIYALVRLGISDSVRIADFLHCSPQTIYNNRLKTRNKSDIPRDEFAERVKLLGKRQ